MCVVLIVVLLICGCIYLYIDFKISRMHSCIPVVCVCVYIYIYIYMCVCGGGGVGGGRVLGWVGEVLCGCVSKR